MNEGIAGVLSLRAKNLGRQVRRHLDSGNGRILSHVTNLVDLDAGIARKRRFQLFRERRRLGVSAGKSAHKAGELRLRSSRAKVNAGNS